MNNREKLIEVLDRFSFSITVNGETVADWNIPMPQIKKALADHLLANGVRLETKQATSEKTSEWISADDRLPFAEYGESDNVLTVDGHGLIEMLYFDGGCWCYPTGETVEYLTQEDRISHWMPLPEPPNDSER